MCNANSDCYLIRLLLCSRYDHIFKRSNIKLRASNYLNGSFVTFRPFFYKFRKLPCIDIDIHTWLSYHVFNSHVYNSLSKSAGFGKFTKPEGSRPDAECNEKGASKHDCSDDKNNDIPDGNNRRRRSSKLFEPSTLFILGLGTVLALEFIDGGGLPNEITMQEFLTKYFLKGHVERIQVVNKDFCRCYLNQNVDNRYPKFITFRIGSVDAFEQRLDDIQVCFLWFLIVYIGSYRQQ